MQPSTRALWDLTHLYGSWSVIECGVKEETIFYGLIRHIAPKELMVNREADEKCSCKSK